MTLCLQEPPKQSCCNTVMSTSLISPTMGSGCIDLVRKNTLNMCIVYRCNVNCGIKYFTHITVFKVHINAVFFYHLQGIWQTVTVKYNNNTNISVRAAQLRSIHNDSKHHTR